LLDAVLKLLREKVGKRLVPAGVRTETGVDLLIVAGQDAWKTRPLPEKIRGCGPLPGLSLGLSRLAPRRHPTPELGS